MFVKTALKVIGPTPPIKLDLGCGTRKKEGFVGVDRRKFDGVDVVADLLTFPWPWADESVEEVRMSHVLEHFTGIQRVRIANELYRIMQTGAKATIQTPHWCSNRAYGDFTHQWPPVSEMWFQYLSRTWREREAPDNDIRWNPEGYSCDFEHSLAYMLHPAIANENQERKQFSM